MRPFEIIDPKSVDPSPRFFKTAGGTMRHICILPPFNTLTPSGQILAQELGTIEIKSHPTSVDGLRARVMEMRDPNFGKSYVEVTPSDRERAGAEVESGMIRKEYPEVKKGQLDVAAIHLKGHGATDEDLRDAKGVYNYMKVKKVAKKLGVGFPNLF